MCKISVQRGRPPCENCRAVHISPYNSGTVTDRDESSIKANRRSAWAFQRASNQGRASPLTSQNGVQIPKFNVFRINFDKKVLKVC